ncbi:MAG: BMC domain-containing protein [Desulfovibrio sp.]|uniref:BMC domain-containing protein n=1 Tax=Desulfovibrio sp. 7SRBS1 TaxID=3378064 RepID=UPI003B4018F7
MDKLTAIGLIEFSNIHTGIEAADAMLKTAAVTPFCLKTICPGKFIAGVSGEIGAVKSSVDTGKQINTTAVVDCFTIPNVHPDVVAALSACTQITQRKALGVIETFSVASAILAADAAVKAAAVDLLEIRTALGLGGKGYVLLTGDVGAVEAAVATGQECARERGLLVGTTVLPRPDPVLFQQLV